MTGGFEAAPPPLDQVREWHGAVQALRAQAGRSGEPFEFVVGGASDPRTARDVIGPLADAGATRWDERMPFGELLDQVDPARRSAPPARPGPTYTRCEAAETMCG